MVISIWSIIDVIVVKPSLFQGKYLFNIHSFIWGIVFSILTLVFSSNFLDVYLPSLISLDFSSFFVVRKGFSKLSITGKKIMAWKSPNKTVKMKTLKNVINAWDFESQRRTTARKVVAPPFITAGPILCNDFWARSNLEPKKQFQICGKD